MAGGKMRRCGYADVATGKIRKMRINIRILPTYAPCLTEILQPLTFHFINISFQLFANQLRSFNDEFMHI